MAPPHSFIINHYFIKVNDFCLFQESYLYQGGNITFAKKLISISKKEQKASLCEWF